MLDNMWREIDYRLDVLRATKGTHVEVYSCVVKKLLELHFFFFPRSVQPHIFLHVLLILGSLLVLLVVFRFTLRSLKASAIHRNDYATDYYI